jgi:hypothetical protein
MHLIIGLALLLALIYGPQLWVRAVMARHRRERPDFPGTGGQLAEHLLTRSGVEGVAVTLTEAGDHYDPERRCVALTPDHYHGRSLTAVAVAAHEVGHAIQHHSGYTPLLLRQRLARMADGLQRVGSVVVMAAPLFLLAGRSPTALILPVAVGLGGVAVGVVVHLVTLPVELDASFRRALPLLIRGGYLPAADHRRARRILTAAALTYVAGALSQILNLWQWLRMLRR